MNVNHAVLTTVLQRLAILAARAPFSIKIMSSATAAELDVRALEKLKDIYGDLAQVPTFSAGRIQSTGKLIQVSSIWDNHAISLNKSTKTQRSSVIEKVDGTEERRLISTTSMPLTTFESQSFAYSPSDTMVAQLITIPDGKDKKQYLRVFDQNEHIEVLCSDLSGQKKHGLIYGMGAGSFSVVLLSLLTRYSRYCCTKICLCTSSSITNAATTLDGWVIPLLERASFRATA
ncbi:unnamed protein product [Haemonchus placei]|uniref:MMS1_N domain-containing protein n=1 Tax=Haemonchus placei TaxID=6290 RepID=A0A0N4X5M8_HAEPC|nr:unnamed protein product [Haemonchus placei]